MDNPPKSIAEALAELRKARDELAIVVGQAYLDDWRKIKSAVKWLRRKLNS